MRDENELSAAQKSTEAALASLRPVGPALGPDVLMFNAGRAAGIRQVRRWQAAATTLGVLLAVSIFLPRPPGDPRTIIVEKPLPAGTGTVAETDNPPQHQEHRRPSEHIPNALAYASLREDVLTHGVDALRSHTTRASHADSPAAPVRAFETPSTQRPTGNHKTFERLLEIGAGS